MNGKFTNYRFQKCN